MCRKRHVCSSFLKSRAWFVCGLLAGCCSCELLFHRVRVPQHFQHCFTCWSSCAYASLHLFQSELVNVHSIQRAKFRECTPLFGCLLLACYCLAVCCPRVCTCCQEQYQEKTTHYLSGHWLIYPGPSFPRLVILSPFSLAPPRPAKTLVFFEAEH